MTGSGFSRRRFLAITATLGLAAGPAAAQPTTRWRGLALGAEAEITLLGPKRAAGLALRAAKQSLRDLERLFSLYDSQSDLVRLNRSGRLDAPAADFVALLRLADEIHSATGGLFDPTIQPLWRALADRASGEAVAAALSRVGWSGLTFDDRSVAFRHPGMAMTFNGIAQGFATDRVSNLLGGFGFSETLVNIGEFRAGDGAWQIGVADPAFGLVAKRRLERGALATSSPSALLFGEEGIGHILDPRRPQQTALWSTVSVEAKTAAEADGYSTAFTLLDAAAIRSVFQSTPALRRIVLVGRDGTVTDMT